jgi:hypothetical protein
MPGESSGEGAPHPGRPHGPSENAQDGSARHARISPSLPIEPGQATGHDLSRVGVLPGVARAHSRLHVRSCLRMSGARSTSMLLSTFALASMRSSIGGLSVNQELRGRRDRETSPPICSQLEGGLSIT